MPDNTLAMYDPQKAQQVESGDDGTEEQLVRDGFLTIHKQT